MTETTALSHAAGPPAQTGGSAAPSEPLVAPVPVTPVKPAAPVVSIPAPPAADEPDPDAALAAPGTGGVKAAP